MGQGQSHEPVSAEDCQGTKEAVADCPWEADAKTGGPDRDIRTVQKWRPPPTATLIFKRGMGLHCLDKDIDGASKLPKKVLFSVPILRILEFFKNGVED